MSNFQLTEEEMLAIAIDESLKMDKIEVVKEKGVKEDPMLVLARFEDAEIERKKIVENEKKLALAKKIAEDEKKIREKKAEILERKRDAAFIKLCKENKYDVIRLMLVENKSDPIEDFPLVCEHGTSEMIELYLRMGAKFDFYSKSRLVLNPNAKLRGNFFG
ncbi:MAG: hypothetical protein Hyperionvirus18_42 [Hyperionvirus sp.]|uniref:Ankyrin repeat protein n=1 Tax=Hyperionvirus sp. TaxID=2487770 RepID=A0A3G5AA68_9VIRU|nr:MAG: hypothetical protein Hyperionvirus18_42 [Hyperionvirus sp.]